MTYIIAYSQGPACRAPSRSNRAPSLRPRVSCGRGRSWGTAACARPRHLRSPSYVHDLFVHIHVHAKPKPNRTNKHVHRSQTITNAKRGSRKFAHPPLPWHGSWRSARGSGLQRRWSTVRRGGWAESSERLWFFVQFALWCCKPRLLSTYINVIYDGFAGTLSSYRRWRSFAKP